MAAAFLTACLLIAFLCFWWQQLHYTASCAQLAGGRKLPAGEIQQYQSLQEYQCSPALDDYRQQIALLDALILPDTSFIPAADLQAIAAAIPDSRCPLSKFFSADTWSWTLINNRLFIIAALLCFVSFPWRQWT